MPHLPPHGMSELLFPISSPIAFISTNSPSDPRIGIRRQRVFTMLPPGKIVLLLSINYRLLRLIRRRFLAMRLRSSSGICCRVSTCFPITAWPSPAKNKLI